MNTRRERDLSYTSCYCHYSVSLSFYHYVNILWDFDVDQILSANTSGVAAVIPDTDDICVTPLLDVNAGSCNCPNFLATDKVLLSPVDETRERGNPPQPLAGNDDTVDAPNVNIQTRSLVLTGIRRCDVCDFVSTA